MKILNLIIFLTLFTSCKKELTSKINPTNYNTTTKEIQYTITDSIQLNKNKNYSFINLEKYNVDSIYAFTYPQLEFDILNRKGELVNEITKKGDGPGELNKLFTMALCDNKIFLIECDNYYKCYVFDANTLEYITLIDLQEQESSMFPYPLISSFNVIKQNTDYILTFAGSNFTHSTENKQYYKENNAIAEYRIDQKFNVIKYTERLPYYKFESMIRNLNSNIRFWDHAIVQYKHYKSNNIIAPFFSDSIFVYNKDWKLTKKIKINFKNRKNHTVSFAKIGGIEKRLKQDFALRFANRNFYSMDIQNDKIFLLYPEEVNVNEIPQNSEQYKYFAPKATLLCIDLNTNSQFKINLPEKVSYYGGFKVLNNNTIIIPSNTMYQEDFYLYQINISAND